MVGGVHVSLCECECNENDAAAADDDKDVGVREKRGSVPHSTQSEGKRQPRRRKACMHSQLCGAGCIHRLAYIY